MLSRLLSRVFSVCLTPNLNMLCTSKDHWINYLFEKPCYFSIMFYISKDTWLYHCVFVYNLLKWPVCACLKTFPTYVFFVLLKASDLCILCSSNDFWPGYSVFVKIIQTWVFFIYIYITNWKQTELFVRPNYNYQWYSYYYECKCYDIIIQISSFNIYIT